MISWEWLLPVALIAFLLGRLSGALMMDRVSRRGRR